MSTLDNQLAIIADIKRREVERLEAVRALRNALDPRAVEPLLAAIDHETHWLAIEILRALGEIGAETAREPLEQMLKDKEKSKLHPNIVEALGKIRSLATFDTLVKQLSVSNSDTRWYASEALARLAMDHSGVFERLIPLLFDKKRTSSFAKHLIHTFDLLDDPRIVEVLSQVVMEGQQRLPPRSDFSDQKKAYNYAEKQRKEAQVRSAAASCLGYIGDTRALPALLHAIADTHEDSGVHMTALVAVANIGHRDAVEPLIKVLQSQYARGAVDERVMEILGGLGDKRAVDTIVQVMHMPLQGRYPYSRILYAAEALLQLGDPRAFEGFVQALTMPQDKDSYFISMMQRAAEGLGKLGNPQAIPYLINAFEQTEFMDLRYKAAHALARLGDNRGADLLLAWLRGEFPNTYIASYYAPEALGDVRGDPHINDVLFEIIRDELDETDTMHTNAAMSLARLGDTRAVEYWLKRLDNTVKRGPAGWLMTHYHKASPLYYDQRVLNALVLMDDARILPALEAAQATISERNNPHLPAMLAKAIEQISKR